MTCCLIKNPCIVYQDRPREVSTHTGKRTFFNEKIHQSESLSRIARRDLRFLDIPGLTVEDGVSPGSSAGVATSSSDEESARIRRRLLLFRVLDSSSSSDRIRLDSGNLDDSSSGDFSGRENDPLSDFSRKSIRYLRAAGFSTAGIRQYCSC